jgi:FSR family fosmidomycin resistance protein-like MFS transporter
MTQTVDLPRPNERTAETKLVGSVCFAHFVSHYYIMLLAPLFLVIRADYGVTYTELGLALTLSNIVSTVFQTPAGFLSDRVSARIVLIVGLLLGAGALAVAGLVNSFWVFVAMFGIVGLGNTVYHPADYSLLSHHVPAERAGRVFSFHTFAGMLGNAAAPATLVYLQQTMGWRGAFLVAASLGLVAALILVWQGEPQTAPARVAREKKSEPRGTAVDGWRLLTATPILLSLLFFILLSFCGGGLSNYLIVGLGALHGTPPEVANSALTSLLVMSAVGVLVGGVLTGWTSHHGAVAAAGLIVTATVCTLIGLVDFGTLTLVLLLSAAGFCSGITMPSRDLIVRSVTPPGAYGRVFGFVSTGFNIAGIVLPVIFGQLLDHGYPRALFLVMASCALLAMIAALVTASSRPAETKPIVNSVS